MKRGIFTMLCIVILCCFSMGQTITGSAIPDATAQRLYFLNLMNMTASDRSDYLTNNLQLASIDIAYTLTQINVFQTSYNQAVTNFNNTVNGAGWSSGLQTSFQNNLANVTATTMVNIQNHLTQDGYSTVTADITASKNNMNIPDNTATGMACCYSDVRSNVTGVKSVSPQHVTVTVYHTVEGNVASYVPIIVYHYGRIILQVGTHYVTVNGPQVRPNVYINTTGSVVLDSIADSCLVDNPAPCTDDTTDGIVCTQQGNVFAVSYSLQNEIAYTKFLNIGLSGTGGCVKSGPGLVCTWLVAPICGNTTNPDYKYPNGGAPAWIRDYDFAAWWSLGACERVVWQGGHSTWMCSQIWPLNIGTSDTTPGSCTYTP